MQKLEDILPYCKTQNQEEKVRAYFNYGCNMTQAAKAIGCVRNSMSSVVNRVFKYASIHTKPDVEHKDEIDSDSYILTGTTDYYTFDDEGNRKMRGQWVKNKIDNDKKVEAVKNMVDSMVENVPTRPNIPYKGESNKEKPLLCLIPWGDPHVGMYSWAKETGNDFNLDIAKNDLMNAVSYLIDQSPSDYASRCVFMNLGDFFHVDNMFNQTSHHKNPLDVSGRLPEVIDVGVTIIEFAIQYALERYETVELVNSVGNHDQVLSYALTIMISHAYSDNERVIIHNEPTMRHYIEHGYNLIGSTHGHMTKDQDLPGIMATEMAEAWGRTKHRYFFRGHHHHDAKKEYNGCIVEQFRTLAPEDAYAYGSGYLSGQDMKAIIFHEDYGEVNRITCSIDMLRNY